MPMGWVFLIWHQAGKVVGNWDHQTFNLRGRGRGRGFGNRQVLDFSNLDSEAVWAVDVWVWVGILRY